MTSCRDLPEKRYRHRFGATSLDRNARSRFAKLTTNGIASKWQRAANFVGAQFIAPAVCPGRDESRPYIPDFT